MQIIPLQAVPNQTTTVRLGDQDCQVNLVQKPQGLFMDLLVSNEIVVSGVICENQNPIVRDAYLGFIGDLAFVDNEGSSDPVYTGLGTRFSLAYLSAEELSSA